MQFFLKHSFRSDAEDFDAFKPTLRLPGQKTWVCSGLTLSGASLSRVKGGWRRRWVNTPSPLINAPFDDMMNPELEF
jgi:hypothetical protein